MYRYKQRKGRQHSEWDADGQTIIIEYREKQRGGYRGCCFHCRRGWISGILYRPGGRCRHRRFDPALPYLPPDVSPQWSYRKADTR